MGVLEKRKSLHNQNLEVLRENQVLQNKIEQLEGFAVLGRAWAMAAHEINNLLVPVTSYAQLALQDPDDLKITQKAIHKALTLGERAGQILKQIPLLAGQADLKKEFVLLQDLIQEVFIAIGRDFKKDKIAVDLSIRSDLSIQVDCVSFRQVLMNLILNAREAMIPRGGKLRIEAIRKEEGVEISCSDTGSGIAPDAMNRIFEPLFTTKKGQNGQRNGSGIGLSFCKRVLDNHAGKIHVQSAPNQGTTFTLWLPDDA